MASPRKEKHMPTLKDPNHKYLEMLLNNFRDVVKKSDAIDDSHIIIWGQNFGIKPNENKGESILSTSYTGEQLFGIILCPKRIQEKVKELAHNMRKLLDITIESTTWRLKMLTPDNKIRQVKIEAIDSKILLRCTYFDTNNEPITDIERAWSSPENSLNMGTVFNDLFEAFPNIIFVLFKNWRSEKLMQIIKAKGISCEYIGND